MNFSIQQKNEHNLVIVPSINWTQDDFEIIIAQFFQYFSQIDKIEVITGADRATVRCHWSEHYFYLQMECYIDTIWLEPCDQISGLSLTELAQYMNGCE